MKLAAFAFTAKGCDLARRIGEALHPEAFRAVTMEKFGEADFEIYTPPLSACMEEYFHWADVIAFVGSTGMAVRAIAPWVQSKKTDPAVLCIDEGGKFVVSLLSGHLGGANAYAASLAEVLGATAVITTATDVEGRFSADAWAKAHGFAVSSMVSCKHVSAAILEGDIPMACEREVINYPAGVQPGEKGSLGIYVGIHTRTPFAETLRLVPKAVHLGIGCRRDTPKEKIQRAVDAVLSAHAIDPQAVKGLYSIDLKADEPGLLAFAKENNLPCRFYTAGELKNAPGEYPASEFVRGITGVDNVCQRAAMLGADTIIAAKTAMDGVTVALAEEEWEAVF